METDAGQDMKRWVKVHYWFHDISCILLGLSQARVKKWRRRPLGHDVMKSDVMKYSWCHEINIQLMSEAQAIYSWCHEINDVLWPTSSYPDQHPSPYLAISISDIFSHLNLTYSVRLKPSKNSKTLKHGAGSSQVLRLRVLWTLSALFCTTK